MTEAILYRQVRDEIAAHQECKHPGLPKVEYERSAARLADVVMEGVMNILTPIPTKPTAQKAVRPIPSGISPARAEQMAAMVAGVERRSAERQSALVAQLCENNERRARLLFADTGVTASTIEAVIRVAKQGTSG